MSNSRLMLSPEHLSAGPIASAENGLTLVMPRGKYDSLLLASRTSAGLFAVLLSDRDAFTSFPAENNSYSGLLVRGVHIEVDPRSARDGQYESLPPGSIVRKGSDLLIATMPAEGTRFRTTLMPLTTGLSSLPENQQVGFLDWQVILGAGHDKQVLAHFSIAAPSDR